MSNRVDAPGQPTHDAHIALDQFGNQFRCNRFAVGRWTSRPYHGQTGRPGLGQPTPIKQQHGWIVNLP